MLRAIYLSVFVIIFILTLFSNRAVLALMLAMGALFFQYLEMSRGKKLAKVLTPIALVLLVVGGVTLILYKQRVGWGSFATHIDDFAAALKCWMKYPILGCGYDNEIPIKELMSEFRAHNQGLSNSAAVVLADGLFSWKQKIGILGSGDVSVLGCGDLSYSSVYFLSSGFRVRHN